MSVKELRAAVIVEKKHNQVLKSELIRKEKAPVETAALLMLRQKSGGDSGEGREGAHD